MHSSSSSVASSSSIASSSIFHASLVDPANHSTVLLRLLQAKVSPVLINYVVDRVAATVDYAMGRTSTPVPRSTHVVKFTTFVTNVLTRAEITTPVILSALVYVDRARPHLNIALEEWALERVFLGALIVASKYLNDSTLKNIHWALCTGVFGKRDVGRIEREFLDVLDWNLSITEAELLRVSGEEVPLEIGKTKETAIVIDDEEEDDENAIMIDIEFSSPVPHAYVPRRHHSRTRSIPDLDPSSPASASSSSSSASSPLCTPEPSVVDTVAVRKYDRLPSFEQTHYRHGSTSPQPFSYHRRAAAVFTPQKPQQTQTSTTFADLLRAFPNLPSRGHKRSAPPLGVRVSA